ncbi:MAG: hypothetical protein ACM3ZE_11320 [Myxococcales bacterium]
MATLRMDFLPGFKRRSHALQAGLVASWVLLGCVTTASDASATAAAPAPVALGVSVPYVLRWDAPDECPTSTELRRQLDALSVRDGRDSPLQIDAEVRPSGNQFHLRLQLSGEPARHFDADNCRLLAETLVVLSAVALGSNPAPVATTVEDSQWPKQGERIPNQTTRNEPTKPTKAATAAADQRPTRSGLQTSESSLHLDAAFGTTSSLGTGRAFGVPMLALGLSYRFKFLLAALRASAASSRIAEAERTGADSATTLPSVRIDRWTLNAAICGGGKLGPALSAWEVWLCAEFGPSIWAAAADRLTNSTPRRSVLWFVGAAVRGGWHVAERWTIVGSGQLERPFHRLDWAVKDPTTSRLVTLHKTPAFGTAWTLGIAYSF